MDFPRKIAWWIFPVRYVNVYQRVKGIGMKALESNMAMEDLSFIKNIPFGPQGFPASHV